MYRILNYVTRKWNNCVFKFHDLATKTNISPLVNFSIWAHDKLVWELPEKYQLIGGVSVQQCRLEQQLDIAKHQANYYFEYATELQEQVWKLQDEVDALESNESELATA